MADTLTTSPSRAAIDTARLHLSFLTADDAPQIHALYSDDKPAAPVFSTLSTTASTITRMTTSPRSFVFTIRLLSCPSEIVGLVGLHSGESSELTYRLAPALRGKGLMTEALQAVMSELFVRQPERTALRADVVEQNVGSVRVMEKCGFKRAKYRVEGDIRRELTEGEESDLKAAAAALMRDLGPPRNVRDEVDGELFVEERRGVKWTHWLYRRPAEEGEGGGT
ncbi:acyl-CoA N-acyltransferase [Pseudovirgaria hyperparasitica]|uniref:Acyl-CoA N-acyltransferase n=1 Tax=Pseudovirgaria hyperparasitica TaxID=470096 RepID=A0A6A6WJA4_9PEZI|nr:acyl-CoA N-acyltransferase [Pseudovirgaria hyperparasitica]KAF2762230.1 acyl-CoA N-acyltransferase [Pseudovirgaria hyperparasitica]